MNWNEKDLALLGIQLTLGVLMLYYGIGKLMNPSGFISTVQGIIPWAGVLATLIAVVVILAEVVLGVGLLFSIQRKCMLFLTMLLVLLLSVGILLSGMEGGYTNVANNLNYILLAAVGLMLSAKKK